MAKSNPRQTNANANTGAGAGDDGIDTSTTFEWDDSDVTLTAWSKSRKMKQEQKQQRGYGRNGAKRTYGRRTYGSSSIAFGSGTSGTTSSSNIAFGSGTNSGSSGRSGSGSSSSSRSIRRSSAFRARSILSGTDNTNEDNYGDGDFLSSVFGCASTSASASVPAVSATPKTTTNVTGNSNKGNENAHPNTNTSTSTSTNTKLKTTSSKSTASNSNAHKSSSSTPNNMSTPMTRSRTRNRTTVNTNNKDSNTSGASSGASKSGSASNSNPDLTAALPFSSLYKYGSGSTSAAKPACFKSISRSASKNPNMNMNMSSSLHGNSSNSGGGGGGSSGSGGSILFASPSPFVDASSHSEPGRSSSTGRSTNSSANMIISTPSRSSLTSSSRKRDGRGVCDSPVVYLDDNDGYGYNYGVANDSYENGSNYSYDYNDINGSTHGLHTQQQLSKSSHSRSRSISSNNGNNTSTLNGSAHGHGIPPLSISRRSTSSYGSSRRSRSRIFSPVSTKKLMEEAELAAELASLEASSSSLSASLSVPSHRGSSGSGSFGMGMGPNLGLNVRRSKTSMRRIYDSAPLDYDEEIQVARPLEEDEGQDHFAISSTYNTNTMSLTRANSISAAAQSTEIRRKTEESFQESDDDDEGLLLSTSIVMSASCDTHDHEYEATLDEIHPPEQNSQMSQSQSQTQYIPTTCAIHENDAIPMPTIPLPLSQEFLEGEEDNVCENNNDDNNNNNNSSNRALGTSTKPSRGLPPNRLRRMSSVESGTFEQAIFLPVEEHKNANSNIVNKNSSQNANGPNTKELNARGKNKADAAHSHIFATMSSYEDLKFLIKELRKWKESRQMPMASFGLSSHKNCTIVPPNKWNHERKALFINWTTTLLTPGFCQRSGGGNFNLFYLQTTVNKGEEILKNLEAALLSYKKANRTEDNSRNWKNGHPMKGMHRHRSEDAVEDSQGIEFPFKSSDESEMKAPLSSIKILTRQISTPLLPISRPNLFRMKSYNSTQSQRPMSIEKPCDILGELSGKLDTLNISNIEDGDGEGEGMVACADNSASTSSDSSGRLEDVDVTNYNTNTGRDEFDGATPLSRMVTLPNDHDHSSNTVMKGRLSTESGGGNMLDNNDFVSHMHGISPFVRDTQRNDRYSYGFPNSKKAARSLNMQMQHPHQAAPLSLPRRRNILNNSNSSSQLHAISPVVRIFPSNASLSFDNGADTQTPMPKVDRAWGSRPIEGKDWGESDRCDDKILKILMDRWEEQKASMQIQSHSHAACDHEISLPLMEVQDMQFIRPEMSAVRADSLKLGFDYEVESCISGEGSRDGEKSDIDDDGDLSSETAGNCSIADLNDSSMGKNTNMIKSKIRREKSIAKRNRMSICESGMVSPRPFRASSMNGRISFACGDFASRPTLDRLQTLDESAMSVSILPSISVTLPENQINLDAMTEALSCQTTLLNMFSYLTEYDLMVSASLVSGNWADVVTDAHASLMLISVGCSTALAGGEGDDGVDVNDEVEMNEVDSSTSLQEYSKDQSDGKENTIAMSMERSWDYLTERYPWGMFLSEGTFKRVYKVWNALVGAEEAVSIMNVNLIDNVNVVGSELAVSVMLSSLTRRNICPNFVLVRGVFTSLYEPPCSQWGSAENKRPLGHKYIEAKHNALKAPEPSSDEQGSFQYIRMELCHHGDVEEYIKRQPNKVLSPNLARSLLFQMAFSLYVAGNKFGMKHYDVKLLNFFLSDTNDGPVDHRAHPFTVMRYGLGSHAFNLRMRTKAAITAKLADFGTSDVRAESNGQPVLISNFTTLENTPPDFLILGDVATQGYGHDYFGLGLCMLHLFTGFAPYEEILETVLCPPNLKKKLKNIWESKKVTGYDVIRSVILNDVYEDEEGNIIEGEPDETLYDTLYRFLVLFGIPEQKFQVKEGGKVWRAIDSCLFVEDSSEARRSKRTINAASKRKALDADQFQYDCSIFSVKFGNNVHITQAREMLTSMDGGMDLLLSLVAFDPRKRASALDVVNSTFMEPLRDESTLAETDIVHSYMAYSLNS